MLDKVISFADKYNMLPSKELILVAVSGGADSICLLTALQELSEKRGFTLAAAHYNHQLRGSESDRDAQFVERFCLDRAVMLYSGGGDVAAFAQTEGLGTEEAARKLRYGFLYKTAKNIGAHRIATAHTADDNAETVILNLTRGAGLKGLCGIPPVRDTIIRPMLEISRDEVISFLSQRSISYMDDSSNSLEIYSRNLVRRRLIPVLKQLNPRLTDTISSNAAVLREDEAYLSSLAVRFIKDHSIDGTLPALELSELPLPISSRVLRQIVSGNLSAKHVTAVLDLCRSSSTSGEVSLPSGTFFREYARLVFSSGPLSRGFVPVELPIGGKVDIPELGLSVSCICGSRTEKINKSFTSFLFKYDNICDKIVIRSRKTGDKIELFGRNGTKTLKKLFIEKRIPMRNRPLVPVIADGRGVLAVYGIGFDLRAACCRGDNILEIIFEETTNGK